MTIIQQPTLFDIDYLEQLTIQERHQEIFSPLDFSKILVLFQKEKRVGAPIKVNYEACLRAIVTRYLERIPTTKALVRRLKDDLKFKMSLGFLYSEAIPSEATFSRIYKVLAQHRSVLEELNSDLLNLINSEFSIFDEGISIDATAIDAHSKPIKTDKVTVSATLKQQKMSTEKLFNELTSHPSWGVKVNSQGKNSFWFGYKGHFAVSNTSQYLLAVETTSASIADVSLAIPLIRKLTQFKLPRCHLLMDKGYDASAVYDEAHRLNFEPIIDIRKLPTNHGEVDQFSTPTCLIEESYKYDSFDKRYDALKFTRPETRCRDCPLQHEGLCQKVIKIKQCNDFRQYNKPARGTLAWKKIYAKRSSVERVNAYLKGHYQLSQTNFYKYEHVVIEHLVIQLAYNAKKFANQRLVLKKTKEIVA